MAEAADKAEEVGGTTWARGRCRSERCILGLMMFFFCRRRYHYKKENTTAIMNIISIFWYKLTVPQ